MSTDAIAALATVISTGERGAAQTLAHLVQLRRIIDDEIGWTVRHLRTEEGGALSWAQIGALLGIDRTAAYRRFGGGPGDARKPGGQPKQLRRSGTE